MRAINRLTCIMYLDRRPCSAQQSICVSIYVTIHYCSNWCNSNWCNLIVRSIVISVSELLNNIDPVFCLPHYIEMFLIRLWLHRPCTLCDADNVSGGQTTSLPLDSSMIHLPHRSFYSQQKMTDERSFRITLCTCTQYDEPRMALKKK